ncbi:MAG: GspB domain-containing protein, partial [Desulfobacterales bacterium]|nr:GspB domain-containing protein [Desulfobacterales bacterium]
TTGALIAALWIRAPSPMTDAPGKSEEKPAPVSMAPGAGRPGESAQKPASSPADKHAKTRRSAAPRPLHMEARVSKSAGKAGKTETGRPADIPAAPGSADDEPRVGDEGDAPGPLAAVDDEQAPLTVKREEPPGDEREIPLFKDLPAEIRDRLGRLEINVHAWSKDPSKSLVYVNMRRYRVGERIGDAGPLVESITPEGVVINHGEGLAHLLAK